MSKNVLTIDCDWIRNPEQVVELIRLCKHYHKHPEVYFIKEHQYCAKYLESGDTLYNLDEHHDMGYNEGSMRESKEGIMHRGNWVRTLIEHSLLNGYVWVKNYESYVKEEELEFAEKINKMKTFTWTTDINILYNRDFKKIIICESMCTLPEKYRFIYNALKHIFDKYKEDSIINISKPLKL